MGRTTRGAGFTLVEVLMVIGIIVILIAVLIPTIGKARESSKRTGCASNLRKIGQAIRSYATDNNDAMPRVIWTPATPALQVGQMPAAANPFGAGISNDVTAALFLLVRTQNISPGSFVCPSTDDVPDDFGGNTAGAAIRSNFTDFKTNLSYSYANPYPTSQGDRLGYKFKMKSLDPNFVIAADQNPGVAPTDVDNVNQTNPDAPAATIRLGNSNNHRKVGQNVLYADGRVVFMDTPFAGVNRDNIYLPRGATDPEAPPTDNASDSALVPHDDH
jgi:type II secretory pathway pseudopilin PulG